MKSATTIAAVVGRRSLSSSRLARSYSASATATATATAFVVDAARNNGGRRDPSSSSYYQQGRGVVRRHMGTGTRGARGHGWYVNYRSGRGGRHLQGEYHDRDSLEEMTTWNEAVLGLGKRRAYMDVVVEPRNGPAYDKMIERAAPASGREEEQEQEQEEEEDDGEPPRDTPDDFPVTSILTDGRGRRKGKVFVPLLEDLTGEEYRLEIDLAAAVMPLTCQNFIDLLQMKKKESDDDDGGDGDPNNRGYAGSILYRMQRNVGICGGDVLTNTGTTGMASPDMRSGYPSSPTTGFSPCRTNVDDDPLAMWHLPGTVSMIVTSVQEIDSRFLFCTGPAPHMDGIFRAFGTLTTGSLEKVRSWEKDLLTRNGVPTSHELIVKGCGVLQD